jgi:hypothetical protein
MNASADRRRRWTLQLQLQLQLQLINKEGKIEFIILINYKPSRHFLSEHTCFKNGLLKVTY